jgi:hypothetical protein
MCRLDNFQTVFCFIYPALVFLAFYDKIIETERCQSGCDPAGYLPKGEMGRLAP